MGEELVQVRGPGTAVKAGHDIVHCTLSAGGVERG